MYAVRLGGVIIGHSALEQGDPENRRALGLLAPTAEFARWRALSEELRAAEEAGDRVAGSLAERRRNRELIAETLGWRVLDEAGRPIGRVVSLSDVEPDGVAVEVLFDEPSADQLRSSAG